MAGPTLRPAGGAPADVARPMQAGPGVAMLGWLGAFIAAGVIGGLATIGVADASADPPMWAVVVTAVGAFASMAMMLVLVSRTYGSGRPAADYGLRAARIDLVGVPIGVLGQLVLVPLVYWPLQAIWPDTFATEKLEKYAGDLWDRADGAWLIALILVVALGAPFFEELVYRGLLQGAFQRRFHDVWAMIGVAAFFAAIHFRPVESAGLFAIGLVFGVCALVTRRLAMGLFAHIAFNVVGLIMAASR